MDRRMAEKVRADLEEAVAPVLKKHGLVIDSQSTTYGSRIGWNLVLTRWRVKMYPEILEEQRAEQRAGGA